MINYINMTHVGEWSKATADDNASYLFSIISRVENEGDYYVSVTKLPHRSKESETDYMGFNGFDSLEEAMKFVDMIIDHKHIL